MSWSLIYCVPTRVSSTHCCGSQNYFHDICKVVTYQFVHDWLISPHGANSRGPVTWSHKITHSLQTRHNEVARHSMQASFDHQATLLLETLKQIKLVGLVLDYSQAVRHFPSVEMYAEDLSSWRQNNHSSTDALGWILGCDICSFLVPQRPYNTSRTNWWAALKKPLLWQPKLYNHYHHTKLVSSGRIGWPSRKSSFADLIPAHVSQTQSNLANSNQVKAWCLLKILRLVIQGGRNRGKCLCKLK